MIQLSKCWKMERIFSNLTNSGSDNPVSHSNDSTYDLWGKVNFIRARLLCSVITFSHEKFDKAVARWTFLAQIVGHAVFSSSRW